jgi:AhpC/TSA family
VALTCHRLSPETNGGFSVNIRKFNWPIWAGFLLSLIAFLSYPFVFVWFPVTRDFPWANLLLFGIAAALLFFGVRRAFAPDRPKRSKIAGAILATLGVAIIAFFIFAAFIMSRWLPASHGAPQIGQKAPEFTLSDTNGKPVSLSELVSSPVNGKPAKGVLLVFYRGYW